MKNILLAFCIVLTACGSPYKSGQVKYGPNGEIEGGSGKVRCTPPSKRYAKSIDAVVKANIDSVAFLPQAKLEFGLKQAVTRLTDYSSEGLDLDLILFRICEMANNRGLRPGQVDTLTQQAIRAWSDKKKTTSINLTNNGVNTGLMAGVLVIPEDKDIPLKDNFSITLLKDSQFNSLNKGKIILEIKPRHGAWYRPFVAVLDTEDSVVNGKLRPKDLGGYFYTEGTVIGYIVVNGVETKIKGTSCSANRPALPTVGYLYICDKLPSVVMLGDADDETKRYLVSPAFHVGNL